MDLTNKRIALVGGCDGLYLRDREKVLNYDLIARINGNWIRQGGPCDILFCSGMENGRWDQWCVWREFLHTHRPLIIIAGLWTDLTDKLRGWATAYEVEFDTWEHRKWFRDLKHEYSSRHHYPLTGVTAAYYLSQAPIRELFVTGMDFYQGEDKIQTGDFVEKHNPVEDVKQFNALLSRDNRIKYAGRKEQ